MEWVAGWVEPGQRLLWESRMDGKGGRVIHVCRGIIMYLDQEVPGGEKGHEDLIGGLGYDSDKVVGSHIGGPDEV